MAELEVRQAPRVELVLRWDVEGPEGRKGLVLRLVRSARGPDRLQIHHNFEPSLATRLGAPDLDVPADLLPGLLEALAELNDAQDAEFVIERRGET